MDWWSVGVLEWSAGVLDYGLKEHQRAGKLAAYMTVGDYQSTKGMMIDRQG